MTVEIGQEAPDFTLKGASGDAFRLRDLHGHVRAMLVFYPKDMTSG